MKYISSHTHTFCSSISMLWGVPKNVFCFFFFFFKTVFFSQNLSEPLFISIDRICFSINQNWFKKFRWASICFDRSNLRFWSIENSMRCFQKLIFSSVKHFFKIFFNFSLSIRLGQGSISIFCRYSPFFLQGFPLSKLESPLYPSFCIYFHVFMHKLMHFVGIFGTFQIWGFWWFKPFFLKLIIGFCSYNVINMIFDV